MHGDRRSRATVFKGTEGSISASSKGGNGGATHMTKKADNYTVVTAADVNPTTLMMAM